MIYLIFTLDYEIYGNGEGNPQDLIFKPTNKLNKLFDQYGWKYVNFVEVAELIKFKEYNSNPELSSIEKQIKSMNIDEHEIALHIHPQWFNAEYKKGKWKLDYSEYNICKLSYDKIKNYLDISVSYLKGICNAKYYNPVSFRSGNWLFQPTELVSKVLYELGILVDSSLFKGGVLSYHGINYKKSLNNGYYWRFSSDVNEIDQNGNIIEVPIYSCMVPIWKMYSKKREKIHQQLKRVNFRKKRFTFLMDRLRFFYPRKFDFSKMTYIELKEVVDHLIDLEKKTPTVIKPIVLIGHSKNLSDFQSLKKFLEYVYINNITVTTFQQLLDKKILS